MNQVTATSQRRALAQKHLHAQSQAPQRTPRQRLRLRLLRSWGGHLRPYASPHELPASPRRVLILRPDHLGDLLFATPALHLLRQRFPKTHITALVGPWGQAVLAGNGDVDRLLTCPFPGFTRRSKGGPLAPYRLLQEEARRLRAMQFDLALILRFDHWWGAWLAAAAGIPHRIGYDTAEVRPFLTRPVAYVAGRHEVLQNVGLVLAAGGEQGQAEEDWRLRFAVTAVENEAARRLLAEAGVQEGAAALVAIHPGSGAAVKRWRTEAWSALAVELGRRQGAQIVFTGSAGEAGLVEPILAAVAGAARAMPMPVSLAGRTTLASLAALYQRCHLVIGPDSGPLHLAVAVGAPTVHLYGPVDRRTFGPWGAPSRHRVVTSDWACIPCNRLDWAGRTLAEHGCLRDIEVAQALAEATALLAGGGGQ